jgi:serine phosphatase RsbU (regulator of sigma subunit)
LYIIREKRARQGKLAGQSPAAEDVNYQLYELKGDCQPIAIHAIETGFTTWTVQLQKGDTLYAFSDGYADQKGGPSGRKFLSKNFKKYLLEIQPLSMDAQKDRLEDTLDEWMHGTEQIDDILVMGIRV